MLLTDTFVEKCVENSGFLWKTAEENLVHPLC